MFRGDEAAVWGLPWGGGPGCEAFGSSQALGVFKTLYELFLLNFMLDITDLTLFLYSACSYWKKKITKGGLKFAADHLSKTCEEYTCK